jgi:hypothetical protein
MIERELTDLSPGPRWGLAEPESESEPDAMSADSEATPEPERSQPAVDANAATTLMPVITGDEPPPVSRVERAPKVEPASKAAPAVEPDSKAVAAKTPAPAPEKAASEPEPAPEPEAEPEKPAAPDASGPAADETLGLWTKTMPARPRHRMPAPPRTELEAEAKAPRGRHADFELWSKPPAPAAPQTTQPQSTQPQTAQPDSQTAKAEPQTARPEPETTRREPETVRLELEAKAEPAPRPTRPKPEPESRPEPAPDSTPTQRFKFDPRFDFDFWGKEPAPPPPRTELKPEAEAATETETEAEPVPEPTPAKPDPEPGPRSSRRSTSHEFEERVARDFDFERWTKPAPENRAGTAAGTASDTASAAGSKTRSTSPSDARPSLEERQTVRRDHVPPVGDMDATQIMPALKSKLNPWADPRLAPISDTDADADTDAESDTGSDDEGSPFSKTQTMPRPRAASSAPAEAPAKPGGDAKKEAKAAPATPKEKEKQNDAENWRQSIPFDETGVLIRPKGWSDDDIETALVEMGPLREALTAAQAKIKLDELREAGARAAAPKHPLREAAADRLRRLLHPRPRHGLLAAIMLVQAGLSLRNTNSAFEDEGLYLYSGHLELAHLVDGTQIPEFASYFSGAPVLYPVVGALADQVGGLFAARLLSLLFMLGATGLLYLTARRLFGVRSALCAAALFSSTPSAVFVGGLATYDAPALFLLALAGWIVVRWAGSKWPFYAIAAPLVVLAAATKYAALLFVPTVVVLAAVAAYIHRRRLESIIRPMMLSVLVGALTYGALKLAGPTYVQGIGQTTTDRAQGTTPSWQIIEESARWGGVVFVAAVVGALYYVLRPTRDDDHAAPLADRYARIVLALLLVGTALLAPLDQLRIHTDVSLHKHIGFGLLFAAPLAGYGLVRLVGEHWRRLQLGIGIWALAFAIGIDQSYALFTSWPDQRPLVAVLQKYQKPDAEYLVEDDEPVIYYLRGDTSAEPGQFNSTFDFQYTDAKGQFLLGTPAYQVAIKDGYFQFIALDEALTAPLDKVLVAELNSDTGYKQVAVVNEQAASHNGDGLAEYRVWVKV